MLLITLNVCCSSNMHSSAQWRVVVIDCFLHAVKSFSGARNEFMYGPERNRNMKEGEECRVDAEQRGKKIRVGEG
jgi:hypothetical protein